MRRTEEQVRQLYRDEGWGLVAEACGLDPLHVESSARQAYQVAHDLVRKLQRLEAREWAGTIDRLAFHEIMQQDVAALLKLETPE